MANEPPDWDVFDKHGPSTDGAKFGIYTTVGTVNRFCARYRVAKAFETISLKDFSTATEPGYLALTRAFFTYSAFELFLRAIGMKQKKTQPLLVKFPVADWTTDLRAADTNDIIYKFLLAHGDPDNAHRTHISNYLAKQSFNFTYLASMVRHGFVHGHLTPGAAKATPGHVEGICSVLVKALFQVIDREFSDRMAQLKRVAT
jgi:hypothetical protein